MSDRAVARLVQIRVAQAGYVASDFAGHSLRAGFLTAAARSGASVFKMREVSRHKSMQVLADYVRDAELFRDHAGEGFLWVCCIMGIVGCQAQGHVHDTSNGSSVFFALL